LDALSYANENGLYVAEGYVGYNIFDIGLPETPIVAIVPAVPCVTKIVDPITSGERVFPEVVPTADTAPVDNTSLRTKPEYSVKYAFPLPSSAMPNGFVIDTPVPDPGVVDVVRPLPTIVVTIPAGEILRIR